MTVPLNRVASGSGPIHRYSSVAVASVMRLAATRSSLQSPTLHTPAVTVLLLIVSHLRFTCDTKFYSTPELSLGGDLWSWSLCLVGDPTYSDEFSQKFLGSIHILFQSSTSCLLLTVKCRTAVKAGGIPMEEQVDRE